MKKVILSRYSNILFFFCYSLLVTRGIAQMTTPVILGKLTPTPTCVEQTGGQPIHNLCQVIFTMNNGEKIKGYIGDQGYGNHCSPNPSDLGEIINKRLKKAKKFQESLKRLKRPPINQEVLFFKLYQEVVKIDQPLLKPFTWVLAVDKSTVKEFDSRDVQRAESFAGELNGHSEEEIRYFTKEEIDLLSGRKAYAGFSDNSGMTFDGKYYLLSFSPRIGTKGLINLNQKYNLRQVFDNPTHESSEVYKKMEPIKKELLKRKVLFLEISYGF
jgi:hypothetical protein